MAENVKQLSRLPFWIGLRDVDENGVDYKLLSTGKLPSFTQWCVPCYVVDNLAQAQWARKFVNSNKLISRKFFLTKFHFLQFQK